MSSIPPLSVTVTAARWSCVLDTDLALSRHGLFLAQRLGEELNLWLVRELWQILDNTEYYIANQELLKPTRFREQRFGHDSGPDYHSIRNIFKQWEWARIATDLAGLKLFWIGDAVYESLFPPGIDTNLVYRFETLAESLEERIKADKTDCGDEEILRNCFRDAVALAAALIPYKGFILARHGRKETNCSEHEPVICSFLRAWGISCYEIRREERNHFRREYLNPILARSGISELLWAGLNLAAVHLVVPDAVVMPPPERDEEFYNDELQATNRTKYDWWKDAACFWYPL